MLRERVIVTVATSLILFSLLVGVQVTQAQQTSIPTPSVPEFIVELTHHSYDQPALYSIDPYTGANVTVIPFTHNEWDTVTIKITNQPFTPYNDSNSNLIELYYNVRTKGHFSSTWTEFYHAPIDYSDQPEKAYPIQSDSNLTTLDLGSNYPANGQVDFQVQAMIGYFHDVYTGVILPGNGYTQVFVGNTSNWSNTQTITMPETSTPTSAPTQSPTPTLTPTGTPTQTTSASPSVVSSPSLSVSPQSSASSQLGFYEVIAGLIAVIVVLAAVIVALLVKIRRGTHR